MHFRVCLILIILCQVTFGFGCRFYLNKAADFFFRKQNPIRDTLKADLTNPTEYQFFKNLVLSLKVNNQFQERIWLYRNSGLKEQAETLQQELIHKMQKSPVVKVVKLNSYRHSRVFRVTLENGMSGIYKPYNETNLKLVDHVRRELFAFNIDLKWGLNVVPTTIEKSVNGMLGSFQIFLRGYISGEDAAKSFSFRLRFEEMTGYPIEDTYGRNIYFPDAYLNHKINLLDYIFLNSDRSTSNFLMLSPVYQIAIDHARFFSDSFNPVVRDNKFLSEVWKYDPGDETLKLLENTTEAELYQMAQNLNVDDKKFKEVVRRKELVVKVFKIARLPIESRFKELMNANLVVPSDPKIFYSSAFDYKYQEYWGMKEEQAPLAYLNYLKGPYLLVYDGESENIDQLYYHSWITRTERNALLAHLVNNLNPR